MKIAVIMPTKGRPAGMAASLRAFWAAQSDRHQVQYVVSYCGDDEATFAEALRLPPDMDALIQRRPDHCTPGGAINAAVAAVQADAYVGVGDDVFPMTPGWDQWIAAALEQAGPIASWTETTDQANNSYLFASSRFVNALGSPLLPDYFPYWFIDMWLAEICHFAFGNRPPIIQGLYIGGRRGKTTGMRELPLWLDLFTATRPERMELARKLVAEFPERAGGDLQEILRIYAAWDADIRHKERGFEEKFSDAREPELYYKLARERAIAILGKAAA